MEGTYGGVNSEDLMSSYNSSADCSPSNMLKEKYSSQNTLN